MSSRIKKDKQAAIAVAAGLPQGAFSVDASGQACYRIKVLTPPGIAGLQPELELVYNHRQSNSTLGVGWGLSGLSAITRTKATYAQDGFNGAVDYSNEDRYVLDSQRLINLQGEYGGAGTVYNTELQTWKLIRAGASPEAGFTVVTKNGQVWKYGTTPDSCIRAAGADHVRVWALHSVEDTNGNRMEFRYTLTPVAGSSPSGAYYIDSIHYSLRHGMAARCFVQFVYEERRDPIASYLGGYPILTSYRLSRIDTGIDDTVIAASYAFTYQTSPGTRLSRLEAITQSGAAAGGSPVPASEGALVPAAEGALVPAAEGALVPAAEGAPALPAVRLIWQDTAEPGFDISPASVLDQHLGQSNIQVMDVSGTGRSDVVQFWTDHEENIHATTYLATTDNDGTQFIRAADSVLGAFPATRQFFAADVNGDGRTDLLLAFKSGLEETLHLAVFLSDGIGFIDGGVFNTGDTWTSKHINFMAMDVNGDGRTDLVETFAHNDPNLGDVLCFRSYLSRFGDGSGELFTQAIESRTEDPAYPVKQLDLWPMDVNGDGMMDIVRVWQRGVDDHVIATAYISVSSGIDRVSFAKQTDSDLGVLRLSNEIAFLPVDVNGDGAQDLLHVWKESGPLGDILHLTTFLCDCNGGFVTGPDSVFLNQSISRDDFFPMGFSGGSQTNLVCKWISGNDDLMFTVYASSPQGLFRQVTDFMAGKAGTAFENASFFIGDVNGDGKADLICATYNEHDQLKLVPYCSAGPYPDLISSISNQLGGMISIEYAPITDVSVYTAAGEDMAFPKTQGRRYPNPLSPTQFPVQAVLGQALYVVSGYSEYNDPLVNRFHYRSGYRMSYTGGQLDLMGRGWEGFKTVTRLNCTNGQKNTRVYNLGFPFTGTLQYEIIEADGRYATDPRVPKDDPAVLLQRVAHTYEQAFRAWGATDTSEPVVEVLETARQTQVYVYGVFDYATRSTYEYDGYGNRIKEVYWGYVNPDTRQPVYPDEVVYRYNRYQNDISEDGWALGFLLYAKVSANATDIDITRFFPGDYRLEQRSYMPGSYNLATKAGWDNVHSGYFTVGYAYDPYGNKIAETAPGGAMTTWVYDPHYHTYPTAKIQPPDDRGERLEAGYGYDPRFGTIIANRNENGFVFITALDAFGRKVVSQGPVPAVEGVRADVNVLSPFVTGGADERKVFLSAVVVTTEKIDYLDDGVGGIYTRTESLQDFSAGEAETFLWKQVYSDARGRTRETVQQSGQDAGNILQLTDYSEGGKPLLQSLPFLATDPVSPRALHFVAYSYDVLDRPISKLTPAGRDGNDCSISTWHYGAGGVVTVTTAAGTDYAYIQVQEHHLYDGRDKVKQVTAPGDGNAITRFDYDALARLCKTTDPATESNPHGVSNVLTYNSLDQKCSLDNPDQNTSDDPSIKAFVYGYDENTGLLMTVTDAAGGKTVYAYDPLGRVTRKTLWDGRVIQNVYDEGVNGKGLLASTTVYAPNQSVESAQVFGYDEYGNTNGVSLTIQEAGVFVTSSEFDPQRRLIRQVQPDQTVLSRVYRFGVLTAQTLDGARVDYPLDGYNALGAPGKIDYGSAELGSGAAELGSGAAEVGSGSAVATEYVFNPAGSVYGEKVYNSEGMVAQFEYRYDLLHELLAIDDVLDADRSQSFGYRNKRLVNAVTPGFAAGDYRYDASGNMVMKDGGGYVNRAHFVESITCGGATVYSASQDRCGRIRTRTRDGQTVGFDYNGMGCLERVFAADGRVLQDARYDGQGNRLRVTRADGVVELFVGAAYKIIYSGQDVVIEKFISDNEGVAAKIETAGADRQIRYFRRDRKGSVTISFDAVGKVLGQLSYDGYGVSLVSRGVVGEGVRYESRSWDAAVGLYYFGARYYDPHIGRFITADSQLGSESWLQADALNRFAFELNNPVNYIDSDGHAADWIGGLVIGLTIFAVGAGIVLTGGAAAVAGGVLATALITAGASAVAYSATHQDDFSWENFGIQTSISFGIGLVSGFAFAGLASATAGIGVLRSIAYNALGGAVISGASDVLSQTFTNLATGEDVTAGLKEAAIFGTSFGFLGGGLNGAIAKRLERAAEEAGATSIFIKTQTKYEADLLSVDHVDTLLWKTTTFGDIRAGVQQRALRSLGKATALSASMALPVLPEALLEGELG